MYKRDINTNQRYLIVYNLFRFYWMNTDLSKDHIRFGKIICIMLKIQEIYNSFIHYIKEH